jgi:hypothetical protein
MRNGMRKKSDSDPDAHGLCIAKRRPLEVMAANPTDAVT